ncbi:MAG: saccharopine dehydrogenase C-terminal domain-containing protein [Candidatus Eremiobacteraeota bacterium]|nr:saccharopine dehydrogenase C-terminal domain-containing protein [Candidatus Eremiobacteraeota bacterium]
MKIAVLGAGLVGSAIVKDLASEPGYHIKAIDVNQQILERLRVEASVEVEQADIRQEGKVAALVAGSDLVINAVPGFMGFDTLKSIIGAKINVVDICFFPEDPFLLDELARSMGVTAIVDCGVAPGFCNIILGSLSSSLDEITSYTCYVGGLPQVRMLPYQYKAAFSPIDVLEEYTRPARFVEYGQQVVRPALSDPEMIDFQGVGTLEAFNTDGLRSLMQTMKIPFMKEKTLRYPGHINLMRTFREGGFFSTVPLEVKGQMVRPIDLTSKLLFEHWKFHEGEADFTIMEVIIEGNKGGRSLRYTHYLLDRFDEKTQITSMARTTGYTCTIVARQVIKGLFTQKGICPPEYIGRTAGCYDNILEEYRKRNIKVTEKVEEL